MLGVDVQRQTQPLSWGPAGGGGQGQRRERATGRHSAAGEPQGAPEGGDHVTLREAQEGP